MAFGCLVISTLPISASAAAPIPPKHLIALADRDDPVGMRQLGEFYWNHWNRASDQDALNKAVFWIERAATCDDIRAQLMISRLYELGIGVRQDSQQASWYAMLAARAGDMDAQFRYANFLKDGYGIAQDLEKANFWYRRAANQGHAGAAALLDALTVQEKKTQVACVGIPPGAAASCSPPKQ